MECKRPSFNEATTTFLDFLRSNQWSTSLLWLTRERITGYKQSLWIYRPDELTSPDATRNFYNSIHKTDQNIRMDGLIQFGSRTLAYVENHGGNGKMLNYGFHKSDFDVHIVQSPIYWSIIRLINRTRGISPFLNNIKMAEQNQHRQRTP
jgi:hypothetical protein